MWLQGASAAIAALYAAKIEAARRDGSMTASDRDAAIRALHDERHHALLSLAWKRQALAVAAREQRAAERFSDRAARRQARGSPVP